MVKFAIALCILLIIWDAESASDVAKITKRLDTLLKTIEKKCNKATSELTGIMDKSSSARNTYLQNIDATREKAIADWETVIESLEAQYGSGSTCVSSNIQFPELVELAVSTEIKRVTNSLAQLKFDYDEIVPGLENFASKIDDMRHLAEECTSDSSDAHDCLEWIRTSVQNDAPPELEYLTEEAEVIEKALKKYKKEIESRKPTTVFSKLLDEGKRAHVVIKECLIANSIL